jgi:hypothetical protein
LTIVNIRGTSGSGKSTLVHKLLEEYDNFPITSILSDWKKPKIISYKVDTYTSKPTFVVGRYETQCGGCDSMSYKGSHKDIETLIRGFLQLGNVIFEGLTISSTLTRWRRISEENPGQFVWGFMTTTEEECHQRILSRNGGKEPKHKGKDNLADYQIKHKYCMRHMAKLKEEGERVLELTSDDVGYKKLLEVLNSPQP